MKKKSKHEKTVLIAVLGTSPSVLTETLWALHKELPDYLPDEVCVCTTSTGYEMIIKALTSSPSGNSTLWEELKQAIGKTEISIRYCVFSKQGCNDEKLSDIKTNDDQELVADQLLKVVRGYKDPMQERYRIVCSIAGGRKSMGALMYAVMSLAGESRDIITHVLADENATDSRDFFYPEQVMHRCKTRGGIDFVATDARIELAQIPFVSLRGLLGEQKADAVAGSFSALVKRASSALYTRACDNIKISICCSSCEAYVNDRPIHLSEEAYVLFAIMVRFRMQMLQDQTQGRRFNAQGWGIIFKLLLEEKRLPMNIQEKYKISPPASRDQFYNDLDDVLKDSSQRALPSSFTSVKFKLKESLEKEELYDIIKDALPRGKIGFIQIHNVSFIP